MILKTNSMNSKLYRCGYCGCPTDERGNNLEGENFKKVISLIKNYKASAHTHLVDGKCCSGDGESQQREMVQITREMAIDAGDRSLEGQWIKWH